MFEVQLINRVAWDNNIREADPNELGWKDTVKVNPLQDTIVALRPVKIDLPFDIPDSVRPLDVTRPLGVELRNTVNVFDRPDNRLPSLTTWSTSAGSTYGTATSWHTKRTT